jgi:hypothetical protein
MAPSGNNAAVQAIVEAAIAGNKSKLRQLKAKHGIDVALEGPRLTALHLAATQSVGAVRLLIEGKTAHTLLNTIRT